MAVKSRGSRNVVHLARPTLRETLGRLAPGTDLRDGLERILRGRTGALIVLGYDDSVEAICDGGFNLDVRYAPTKLRELSKMDGAVVLSSDGSRILKANVQLVPDPSIPTDESGTRHRSAERCRVPDSSVGMDGSGTSCTLALRMREPSLESTTAPSILDSSRSLVGA